jgi:hypothetical protein
MQSAITGHSFPELNWILDEGENTVIFCKTIALGFRIVCYLWSKAANEVSAARAFLISVYRVEVEYMRSVVDDTFE